ncbi:MAG: DNA internalization-related competence protein ComEC/Rec2 [Nitrospirota bacterium]
MVFFLSFLTGIVLFYSFQYFPFSTIFAFLLSSIYLFIKRRFLPILIILSGIAFAFIRYEPAKDMSYIRGKEVVVRGIFKSYPAETESGMFKQSLDIGSAVDIKTGERLNDLVGQEIILFLDREFYTASEYEITIKFSGDRTRFNPGSWSSDKLYANLLDVRGLTGETEFPPCISKIREFRYRLNRYIDENFKKDSGAFIAAITTGERANIDEELRDAFNTTGLAHILSISGTHFGLFSVFLFGIFRLLITALPYRILQRITIFLTPSQAAAILCLPFMLAYLSLSGGSIPAVRSFIMIGLFLLGLVIGRKGFWLNSLLFAAFILTVWEPKVIFSLSFQLSFLAVLFIGFSLWNKEDEKKESSKVFRYLKNAVLLTLSASIGTAPLVAYHFHYFSIISPISNLLIAPFTGFILIPLSLLSSFLFLLTGYYVFTPVVSTVSDVSILLVRLLSKIPFADIKIPAFPLIIVLLFYTGFIFYFLLGRKRYTLIIPFVAIMIYLSLSIFEKQKLSVTYLDVGQGDSSVIELPDGKTIVIDTGRSGRETASFLKYKGKETIDVIILSHVHPDHTGGLGYILKRFGVEELWDNGRLIYPGNYISNINHRTLSRGDMVECSGYTIYVFHPYPEFYTMYGNEYLEANNDSVVLKIEGRDKSFLFAGDIEEEAEEDIVHLSRWLKSDVIKVPHHGSKVSAYEPFFKAVSPKFAVISVGRDNPFGHPHKEILDALHGAKIFRTDLDGAIKIEELGKGLEIKTYKDFQLSRARTFRDEMKNIKRLFERW